MHIPFEHLPDNARIWVYSANRSLNAQEQELISKGLSSFIHAWQSHQVDVKASFIIKNDRFIIIGSDESSHGVSGCGIDKSVHQMQELEKTLDISLLDKSFVYFELQGQLTSIPFTEIRKQVETGRVSHSTLFFNTLLNTKGQLESQFKIPASEGWVKKYLSGLAIS